MTDYLCDDCDAKLIMDSEALMGDLEGQMEFFEYLEHASDTGTPGLCSICGEPQPPQML